MMDSSFAWVGCFSVQKAMRGRLLSPTHRNLISYSDF
jgi:hypothetical protein